MIRPASAALLLALWAGGADAQAVSRDTLAARVAAGDSAWARDDQPAARVAYAFVVRADSTFSTRALFRLGLLEAWRNRFPDALALLRRYVRAEPQDLDGRVALARTYAWANRFPAALAEYDTVLRRDPASREAVLGRATTLAWADRIPEAEAVLTGWLDAQPGDAEAWTRLGQFRRWRGAPHEAEDALLRAVALDSTSRDAQEQLAWVHADIRPSVATLVVRASDSERNDLTHLDVSGTVVPAPGLRLSAVARLRQVSVGGVDPLQVPGAHGALQWQPSGASWQLRAELGAVQYPADGARTEAVQGRAGLRASTRAGRWRAGGGIGREPLDEVRSMAARALMFTVGDADVAFAATPTVSLSLGATRGDVAGAGVRTSRTTVLGTARWTPRRGVSLGVSHRAVRWDEPAFGVFFAPQRWTVTEASLGWERQAELGLQLGGDLALGSQGVAFLSDPITRSTTPRALMRIGWRARPGREILATLVYANVAGAGAITASDYRYGALTVAGRWSF